MTSFPSLPRTLLALSLILPVLALRVSSSFNDQFRAIVVLHRAQQPEPPLCCLKPSPTVDSPEGPEDILLSFEDWKSRQVYPASATSKVDTSTSDTPSKPHVQDADVSLLDTHLPSDSSYFTSDDSLPPHFRVPIVDRFNYASIDCSARIHMSHKSAKSPSSILSSTKDRYMLSPCSVDEQFVVVELCDDIRIDTVQLANFEFFSGVFEDFSVSVAKTYTGTNEGWTPAGTYRAKNVRGVQSFHTPTSLRDFYRYIRIDFHSHYGHEYYCPVSLLRVYGLTHLEEWKWDTWLAESRTRLKESSPQQLLTLEHPPAASTSNATRSKVVSNGGTNVSILHPATTESRSNATQSSPADVKSTPTPEVSSFHNLPSTHVLSGERSSTDAFGERTSATSTGDGEQQEPSMQSIGIHSVTEAISSLLSSSSPASVVLTSSPLTEHAYLYAHDSDTHALTTLSSQPSNPSLSPQAQQAPTHAASSGQWSGESIYRTIMNRLTILEANHTLYARYVEEQTAGVREVLRKLNEEVGRLESISRMQAQMYQRTVHEWERQRLRLELEHGELLSRVNYLSDEVTLEKRLGIAQLCLLLAVLVFIGLTRGAPAHHSPPTMHRSARGWNAHNLSFGSSTDGWNPLRRRSPSPTERIASAKAERTIDNRLPFPKPVDNPIPQPEFHATAHGTQGHASRTFKPTAALPVASSYKRGHTSTTIRTPTKPRSPPMIEPHTLPRLESIARSYSSSTSGHPHIRSAKRWARTAHLHEIKVFGERRGSGGGSGGKRAAAVAYRERENHPEGSLGDVFNVSLSMSPFQKIKGRTQLACRRPLIPVHGSEGSTDADIWIDTDVDADDDDDVSVVSERAFVPDSPKRDVFVGL